MKTETTARTKADGTTETLITTYERDAKGRVTKTTLPDGTFTTVEYNAIDKPVRECDRANQCTTHVYDAQGRVVETRYADGTAETTTHDAVGNVIAQRDRDGRTTKWVYDAADRLIETIEPDPAGDDGNDANNPRTRNAYDKAGRLIASTDENGHTTRYEYNAANRRTKVILPATATAPAAELVTGYDAAGRRVSETDAEGRTTTFVYDDASRLIETRHSDGSVAKIEYDALSRKVADIAPSGKRTAYGYDALSRLETVTLAAGTAEATVTRYRYDAQGNRIEQIDAEGRSTRFEFDAVGRETARVLPAGQRESRQYNALGQLAAQTDFNGTTTGFGYDPLGQLIAIDYPRDADVAIAYTANGQRATVTDGNGVTTYAYDAHDRLLRKVDSAGRAVEYQYDRAGNLVSRINAAEALHYTYDSRNCLVSVTALRDGEAARTTRYEYDQAGHRTARVASDGVRTVYGYDGRYRLTSLVQRAAAGALLFAASYTVNADGLRTAVEESDAGGVARTVAYAYDGLNRLIREAIVARDASRSRTAAWTYDRVGNRLTQAVTPAVGAPLATAYVYDANDRLLSETTDGVETRYTYDANGNTLTKSTPGELIEYAYTDANRLREMRTAGARTTYRYDVDGLRIAQTAFPASGPSITTEYLLDTNRDYAQVLEEWTREAGGSPQLAAVLTFADELLSQTRAGVTRVVHGDGFGSTRLLTDASGAVTDTFAYSAFGELLERTGATAVEHLYRGEQFDANLGFYNLRARYYDPANARFLTMDDFAGFGMDPRSLHKYAYAHNDPVSFGDPSGQSPLLASIKLVNQVSILYTVGSISFQLATGNYAGATKEIVEEVVYSRFGGAFGKRVVKYSKEQLEWLYKSASRQLKKPLRLGEPPNARALSHNLEAVGVPRPSNTQAHHIVGGVTDIGKRTQDRLKALGVDLNSAMNGVFLPGCKGSKAVGMVHCGKHTELYEQAVKRRLDAATDQTSAINILNEIRNELLQGTFTKLNSRS